MKKALQKLQTRTGGISMTNHILWNRQFCFLSLVFKFRFAYGKASDFTMSKVFNTMMFRIKEAKTEQSVVLSLNKGPLKVS